MELSRIWLILRLSQLRFIRMKLVMRLKRLLSVQSGVEPKEYPFPANKFIKGNYYRIKGLKSSTEIEWVLENVEDKEVTLDPFE